MMRRNIMIDGTGEVMGEVGGTMQHWALTLDKLLDRAARWHPETEIVTRLPDGTIIRSSYFELHRLAKRVSNALISAGIQPGDRVATLASNGFDHLAVWYGIMGIGAVCHTLNPRLHEDQLAYIANHGGDVMLFADGVLSPVAGKIAARAPCIERIVTINDNVGDGPYPSLAAFIEGSGIDCVWGGFDENTTAGLCYTSGTTGDPKGVAYTHRSNTLLAMNTITPDAFGLSAQDVIMPVVPMFHANTWGLAFSAPAVGAKLVLPGPRLDGQSLHELIEGEGVTFSAGVPTVWQGYVDYLHQHGITRSSLQRVVIGGSACSVALMDAVEVLGIRVIHAWGMTELSPVGLVATPTPEIKALSAAEQHEMALKQGRPLGIDVRIVDDAGIVLLHDGVAVGNLEVCGPTVIDRYVGHSESALNAEGWFDTGDIATIDPYGYVRITDRAKDIIKSGGEWISSVDIENALLGHPNVALAAVIGVPHKRWGERPKLFVQLREPASDVPETFQAYLVGRIERWWMPDEVEIIDAIPIGATGKVDKKALRAINQTR